MKKISWKQYLAVFLVVFTIVIPLSSCNKIIPQKDTNQSSDKLSEKEITVLREEFDKFCEEHAKKIIEESPLNATFMYSDLESLGLEELLYQLDDASDEASLAQIEEAKAVLKYLEGIKPRYLTEEQQKTYKMLEFQNNTIVKGEKYLHYYNAFQPASGIQINIPISLMQIELESEKEVQAYLVRVKQLPRLFDQVLDYERQRAKEKLLLPPYMYDLIIGQINEMLVEPENFMMYLSFSDRVDALESLSEEAGAKYKADFLEIVKNDIYPAYEKMTADLEEIKAQSTNKLGLPEWKNGKDYYDYLVWCNTSYNMDAEDLRFWAQQEFNIALEGVQTFLKNHPDITDQELSDFFNRVNSKESLYAVQDEYMKEAFLEYNVARASENIIPTYLVEHLPPAFYFPISIDGEDYGNMYMKEEAFNTITIDTLVTDIHENIPGHHLYFSILYNSDLPLVRKVYDFASYTEGWAQYVQDKTYEYAANDEEIAQFWRDYTRIDAALRILLDIMVNYDGISKEDALQQMMDMGYDRASAESSYNRMLANPGEMLNYFYGSATIESYLSECEEAMGEAFDIKDFHDLILRNGGLPFYVMDDVIKDYIKAGK